MSDIGVLAARGLIGGLLVVAFALVGEVLSPKAFAGLFSAAPSVAIASLVITVSAEGAAHAQDSTTGMVVGVLGMAASCIVAAAAIPRLQALWGSVLAWIAWSLVSAGLYWAVFLGRADGPELAPVLHLSKLREVRVGDYLMRFVLGAGISVAAGIVGKTVGARFGGAFLAFPAILPASLTLIEGKEGARKADRNAIGAVLGAVGLLAFAGVGEALLTRTDAVVAIALAFVGWVLVSLGLYALLAFLRPDDCDARAD